MTPVMYDRISGVKVHETVKIKERGDCQWNRAPRCQCSAHVDREMSVDARFC